MSEPINAESEEAIRSKDWIIRFVPILHLACKSTNVGALFNRRHSARPRAACNATFFNSCCSHHGHRQTVPCSHSSLSSRLTRLDRYRIRNSRLFSPASFAFARSILRFILRSPLIFLLRLSPGPKPTQKNQAANAGPNCRRSASRTAIQRSKRMPCCSWVISEFNFLGWCTTNGSLLPPSGHNMSQQPFSQTFVFGSRPR